MKFKPFKHSKRAILINSIKKRTHHSMRKAIALASSRPVDIRKVRDAIQKSITPRGVEKLKTSIALMSVEEELLLDSRNLILGGMRACSVNHLDTALELFQQYQEKLILDDDDRIFREYILILIKSSLNDVAAGMLKQRDDPWSKKKLAEISFRVVYSRNPDLVLEQQRINDYIEILRQIEGEDFEEESINRHLFSLLKDVRPLVAIEYGQKVREYSDVRFNRVLVRVLTDSGKDEDALELCAAVVEATDDHWHQQKLQALQSIAKVPDYLSPLISDTDSLVEDSTIEPLIDEFLSLEPDGPVMKYVFGKLFWRHRKHRRNSTACLKVGKQLANSGKIDSAIAIKIADLHLHFGSFSDALESLNLEIEDADSTKLSNKRYAVEQLSKLLDEDYPTADKKNATIDSIENRVLYMLHNSLPYESGGYATRTHGLLCGMKENGIDIHGVSRLGYPWDRSKHRDKPLIKNDDIDNIPYHRLIPNGDGHGQIPLRDYLKKYSEALIDETIILKPSVIHAASNYMNGFAANEAGRILGIPTVYEVRGLWEVTRISRQPDWKDTEYYNMQLKMEAKACKDADVVITITNALKEELVRRGVEKEKITVVTNGVHPERFTPREADAELKNRLGFTDEVIIGYIGSIVSYEGLELLVEACSILHDRGMTGFKVMIVGDGAVLDNVKTLAENSSASQLFTFTGRVPHEEVEAYYSLVDIAPFPRYSLPVTEMVSPLKPFEAMSMEKCVISSNVAALEEIVEDGVTGLLFQKDDVESLADVLQKAINDEGLRRKLGKQSRQWVIRERDWNVLSRKLSNIYFELQDH